MEKEGNGKRIKVGRKERESEETKNMENEGRSFLESMKIEERCSYGPAHHRHGELGPFYPNNLNTRQARDAVHQVPHPWPREQCLGVHGVGVQDYQEDKALSVRGGD